MNVIPLTTPPSVRWLAITAVWHSIGDRVSVSLEHYHAATRDWVVVPIRSGEEIVGGVLIRHHEMHLGVTRTPDRSSRAIVRQVLEKALLAYGSVVTIGYRSNPQGLEFCKRLGFEVMWEDEETIQLRCTRCPYA